MAVTVPVALTVLAAPAYPDGTTIRIGDAVSLLTPTHPTEVPPGTAFPLPPTKRTGTVIAAVNRKGSAVVYVRFPYPVMGRATTGILDVTPDKLTRV